MTLSSRINFLIFVSLAVLLTVFGWIDIQGENKTLDARLDSVGRSIVDSVATYSVDPLLLEDYPVLESVLHNLARSNPEILSLKVEKSGITVAEFQSSEEGQGRTYSADILVGESNEGGTRNYGVVHLVLSDEEHLKNVRKRIKEVAILFAVTFVFLLVSLSLLLGRSVVSRIVRLTRYAEQIDEGLSVSEVSIEQDRRFLFAQSPDEIDRLSSSLSRMHGSVDERQKLLESYNENLETAILERTHQLNEAKDRAESSDRVKSAFLANMSHEVRTPMNGVMTMAEVLLRTELKDQQRDYVENIQISCMSLLTVLNDILDFSKVENGTLELSNRNCAIMDILFDVETLFREQIEKKGLEFELHIDRSMPLYLYLDSGRLRQVLVNLISNSIKFTMRGKIILRAQVLECENPDLVRIKFEIEDTGSGISPKDQERIFERFSQIDDSFSRLSGGSGLGLAISSHVIEKMGGSIGVESELGKGSCFWFELTLQEGENPFDEEQTSTKALATGRSKGRLLLAEDEPISRMGAKTLLEAEGYEVAVAENGVEAMDILRLGRFDLIIMDVHMPIMDGLEATRKIREANWNIPILGFTASITSDERELYMAAGMNDVVAKPLEVKALNLAIERVRKSCDSVPRSAV